MAKNRSAAGITNIIQYDANRNITFVSGSTTLLTVSSSGALTTSGTITATTLVVQTVTSSVNFITGSTKFGSLIGNTHQFTGSVTVTGSLAVVTTGTELQVNATGVNLGNISTDAHTITGSMAVTGGLVDINRAGQSLRIFPQTSSGSARIQMQNSGSGGLAGANAIIAVESSVGADQFTGTSPFSFVIGTATQKAFHLGANSAVVMTITGSNVGIGTSSPNGNLEVAAATPIIISGASSAGSFHGLEFRQNNTIDAFIKQLPQTGELKLSVGRNSSWGGYMTFFTDTLERMRITSAGRVVIGTPSANSSNANLQVEGTAAVGQMTLRYANAASGRIWKVGPDEFNNFTIYNENNTGAYISYSATSWTANSDIRLKNIINPIENAIAKISTLNPVIYSWKFDESNKENLGLIAQDVEKVFPQVIDINHDGMLGVRYTEMIPVLVKAIQELKSQNDDLQSQINELKA